MCQLPMVVKHFASEWKKWRTLVIVEEDILVLPCIELVRNPLVQVHEELIYIASTTIPVTLIYRYIVIRFYATKY